MAKLVFSFVILLSFSASALDFDKYKDRLRSHMAKMLGENIASTVLGEKKSSVVLPSIPQVKSDATSTDVYRKNQELQKQGESFNKLRLEEKRKYRVAFIQELYQVTRNTDPKESDVIKFLNVLEQGGSREGVYRAITLDSVYGSLESYEEAPEKKLEDFVVYFGEKYLARKFDKNAVGKMNLWSIKRIIVEKALDLMDTLAKRPADLRSWYAVLSSELAQKYPDVWKNNVRRSTSAEYHLKWAKEAPFQHIKSETIIKLHEVMNSLNEPKN